ERQVASLRPRPDTPSSVRKLLTPVPVAMAADVLTPPSGESPAPPAPPVSTALPAARRPTMAPLTPERYELRLALSALQADPVGLARHGGPMLGDGLSGIPPRRAICGRREGRRRDDRAAVLGAQQVRGGAVLRGWAR